MLWEKIKEEMMKDKEEDNLNEDKKGLVYIGTEHIHPHPENPRKDLGDLSELAESLKKNGVMQNLTVVPVEGEAGEYYALIGNRRHGAAQMAGITELPCRIVEDMSRKEQLSTMLEENMQRNDLTIYEQAQGFQLMLDLGETEDSIAQKTGFSKTTIRHRLNIAKLDQGVLKKREQSDNFQLTLKDLYELEQIKDIKTRNKILNEATTSRDIVWKAQNAANEEKRSANERILIEKLEAMGIKAAPKKARDEQWSGKWDRLKKFELDKKPPKRINVKESGKLLYVRWYNDLCIIRKAEKKKVETQEDIAHKERDRKKKEIKALLKEMHRRSHEFVLNIISGKIDALDNEQEMAEEIWKVLIDLNTYLSHSYMRHFFTGKHDYECTQEEKEKADEKITKLSFLHQMLVFLQEEISGRIETCDYYGCYRKETGEKLLRTYAIFEEYGWSFEGDEKKLLDGTHELYEKKEE